jgi:hypothetical protein
MATITVTKMAAKFLFFSDPYQEVLMNGAIDYMAYRLTQPSNPVDEPAKAGLLIFTAELLANAKAHLRAIK